MKLIKYYIICLFISLNGLLSAQTQSHEIWDFLLKKYVAKNGDVNYRSFIKDSAQLNEYLGLLSCNPPSIEWSPTEIQAYWINAYNAFTIQLVLRHYPIKSIKDIGGNIPFINSSWDIKFIQIGNEVLDLNNIEHKKLRKKFKDPRIHMALVCASKSCPQLRPGAFKSKELNKQLDEQSKNFLSDSSKNELSLNIASISKIFKWYNSDFKISGGVRAFINKYSTIKINKKTTIEYKDYNWNLNETFL